MTPSDEMKVCVVQGSPRMGQTHQAVERFLAQAGRHVPLQVDWLWLKDANLKTCRGCHLCIFKGEHLCPLKDDREAIEQRLLSADTVIFASPVYAMSVTALMKNLQDRFAYRLHRPLFFGKTMVALVTSGAVGHKHALKQLAVLEGTGFWSVAQHAFIMPPFPLKEQGRGKLHRRIDEAGDRFGRLLARKPRQPVKLMNVIHYVMAGAVARTFGRHDPADWHYWQDRGWLNRRGFFWQARVPLWMRWVARLAEGAMMGQMRKMVDWDALEAGQSSFSEEKEK